MRRFILSHPWLFALVVATGIIAQGSGPVLALLGRYIIDAINTGNPDELIRFLPTIAVFVTVFTIGFICHGRSLASFTARMKFTLKTRLFQSIMDTKLSDFNQEHSSNYVSVLNNDIETITAKYFTAIPECIKFIVTIMVAIALMVIINPLLALIITITSLVPMIGPVVFSKQLAKTQLGYSTSKMILNQKIKDYLAGFEVIKTFGAEKNIIPKFFSVVEKERVAGYKAKVVAMNLATVTASSFTFMALLVKLIAGFFVLRGYITIGSLIAVVSLSGYIQMPIHVISNHLGDIKSVKEVNTRVLKMMEQKDTKERDTHISALDEGIVFKNVSFGYNQDSLAVKDISYTFEKGKKYALVGHSGSGKSTLVKLIMGYYDNYSGDVLINNTNVRDITRDSLYGIFSALPQNVFLLDDTLKNNVTLYNNYSNLQYNQAIEKASLAEVEANLANGPNTILGEGGNNLSFGQRQRVAIARALLKGSDLLILDEATANLDSITAQSIEQSIVAMEGLTCLLVTHKYSKEILSQCDGIIVMKEGRIFEHGTFDQLYEARGYFYSLYNV